MPSADTTTTTLQTDLRRLGFNHTADQLNDLIAGATRKRWSPTVLLERLVADELEDKHRRSVESRLKRARLGRFKPLADWDWNWPTALDRAALERILTLDFLDRGDNVVLVGAHGLGKTMLAKNIAHQAVLAGHSALFTTAADLLLDLNGQETARALERRLRHYTRPALLVCDEVGYLGYDARAADLIFPARQPPLRAPLTTDHHQSTLQTLGHRLPQRLVRRRADRPLDPPCRDPSARRPELSQTRGRAQSAGAKPPAPAPAWRGKMTTPPTASIRPVDSRPRNRGFRRPTTCRARIPCCSSLFTATVLTPGC